MKQTISKKLRLASLLGGLVVFAALAIGGYFSWAEPLPTKYSGPIEKVTIGIAIAPIGLHFFIAENEGYFADNGLDVEIKRYPSGKAAVGDLIDNKVDMAASAEFGFMGKVSDNSDLRIVASIATTNINYLVANKNKGIEKISDLKGKRIVTVSGTEAEFFLQTFLLLNDISTFDVEINYLNANEVAQSILSGEADAAMIWEPHAYQIKIGLGEENTITWPGQSEKSSYWLLSTTGDFITRNPNIVERSLKALVQAEKFIETNEADAKAILVSHDLDAQFVDDIWQKLNYSIALPQALLMAMEDGMRWKMKNKPPGEKEVPNYLDYIYPDALKLVKFEAMTIIQ